MEFVIALLTLTFLEIVLGVDNIIFISIITNKLSANLQSKARILGLFFAMLFRIGLLISITWLIHHLTAPFFPLENVSKEDIIIQLEHEQDFFKKFALTMHGISIKEVILFAGGIFLLGKSVSEIHHKIAGATKDNLQNKDYSMAKAIVQIVLIDIVFSFDSILTAVGLTENLYAMICAVVVSMGIMLFFSKKIAQYIHEKPTLEMLALSFLILIGFMLILEGVLIEVPKAYIYFAVFFSLIVEFLNIKLRKTSNPIKLNRVISDDDIKAGSPEDKIISKHQHKHLDEV